MTIALLFVFVLAAFVGYFVITRVPPLLHTPLMSATNAISGISLVGSLVLAGADRGTLATLLGFIAVTAATINVVGGFLITDRMLKMFKQRLPGGGGGEAEAKALPGGNGKAPGQEVR
ncbi:MAG TPA: NAD(P) transhydrogenase subunit alpha [Longimicrobium sp.]|nr:NAD(P) transhydrogenase subunit alpha [Longimicrobium sp.]